MQLLIGDNVKRLRRERGMTQEELAEAIGIAGQTVSKWERGDGYPDITTLPLIANFFEVSVDEVLGMEHIRDEERINEGFHRMREIDRAAKSEDFTPERDAERNAKKREIMRNMALEFPHHYTVQYMHAADLVHAGDVEAALPIIARVLENCTDNLVWANTEVLLAQAYEQLGDYEALEKQLNVLPQLQHTREFAKSILQLSETAGAEEAIWLRESASNLFAVCHNMLLKIERIHERLGLEYTEAVTLHKHIQMAWMRLKLIWLAENFDGKYHDFRRKAVYEDETARLEAELGE